MDLLEAHYEEDPHKYKTTGVAARMGDLIGLQQMVWDGRPVDVFDNRGWSPLHEAAYGGFSGCLEFLLRHPDADPNWQNHEKETAILLAARHGHSQCLRALINAQADFNLATCEGFTPLYEAVQAKSYECIRLLIKKGAEVNHSVYTGFTPLHQAASMGNAQITSYLIQQGARLDVRCSNGLTPLFVAVQSGSFDTVRCLLRYAHARGIDQEVVNMAAEDNATPLLIAAQEGHTEIMELLLDHGADANIQVTDTKAGPLQYAVYGGHAGCVSALIPATDMLVFEKDYGVMHPLVQALKWPNTLILRHLLDADLDPGAVRNLDVDQAEEVLTLNDELPEIAGKASLLCHVGRKFSLNGAQFLLDHGLSPNAKQPNGGIELSPLVASLIHRNLPFFCLLLKYGATPNIYYKHVAGNVSMLYALHFDLQPRTDSGEEEEENDVELADKQTVPLIPDSLATDNGPDTCLWIDQRKGSFFLNLFAAGGEVESLLRHPGTGDARTWGLLSLLRLNVYYGTSRDEERLRSSRIQGFAVLALLLCLSYNVTSIPSTLLQLVNSDQAKDLSILAGKNSTLAHLCRVHIFRRLCSQEGKMMDLVASLGLPQTLCDYLLFSELAPHSRTLQALLSQKRE